MKNLWVQNSFTNASWIADITALIEQPDRAVALTCEILNLARELLLLVPSQPDVCEQIRSRWDRDNMVDAFWSAHRIVSSAEMAWFDSDQTRTTGLVPDLGALLGSLQPKQNSITDANRVEGRAPIVLSGTRIDYVDGKAKNPPRRMTFGIDTYSDIWFPYVVGGAHPNADGSRFFDNRQLATIHTPRLNQFLKVVDRLVRDVGGRLEVDRLSSAGARGPWISDCDINLDVATPDLVPADLMDVEWPDLDA